MPISHICSLGWSALSHHRKYFLILANFTYLSFAILVLGLSFWYIVFIGVDESIGRLCLCLIILRMYLNVVAICSPWVEFNLTRKLARIFCFKPVKEPAFLLRWRQFRNRHQAYSWHNRHSMLSSLANSTVKLWQIKLSNAKQKAVLRFWKRYERRWERCLYPMSHRRFTQSLGIALRH